MQELDFSFIGQRIKEIRTGKKLTQESLANITGVNVSHISGGAVFGRGLSSLRHLQTNNVTLPSNLPDTTMLPSFQNSMWMNVSNLDFCTSTQ